MIQLADSTWCHMESSCSVRSMNRRDLVLAVLAASQGRSLTPVQMQKAAFLVTTNIPQVVTEGPLFNFVPYDYGLSTRMFMPKLMP